MATTAATATAAQAMSAVRGGTVKRGDSVGKSTESEDSSPVGRVSSLKRETVEGLMAHDPKRALRGA
ncbi:hypothetical protein GCM10028828_15230 [Corynebacterium tapiri]